MDAEMMKHLSRKQIQAVAIEHGIKGNMKSEDIIRILVTRYPDGVPPKLADTTPASSRNGAASSRNVVMQWSESQGRYIEVPVSAYKQQPPLAAGPSQPQNHYRSLGVFTMPTTNHATAQRPAASSVSPPAPQLAQDASSNSYRHYRNAPEFLPGPQMYSASANVQGRLDQVYARDMCNSSSRPHVQQAPYPVLPPSTVWRAPTSANSETGAINPAQPHKPIQFDDSLQDSASTPVEPPPTRVPTESQPLSSRDERVPPPPSDSRGTHETEPQPAQCKLASDMALYDTVRQMANIANFQQRCQTSLETISDIASISEEDVFSDVDALVRQECFQFQRMTTFIDHVNPELTPRWRDEVIWDKACPTYTDDNDNMLEYDTDDEAAPKSPPPIMVKWHRKLPSRQQSPEGNEIRGDAIDPGPIEVPAVTESASAPASPKRKQVDTVDRSEPQPPKKRTRRSRAAVPPTGASTSGRLTRSATKRKVADERTAYGFEEEEEQDMISVLSILTQHIDDESD